jgi:hypothetical protein
MFIVECRDADMTPVILGDPLLIQVVLENAVLVWLVRR